MEDRGEGILQWSAWSSRVVAAALAIGKKSSSKLHVISSYALTFAASRIEKDKFVDGLWKILDKIPSRNNI